MDWESIIQSFCPSWQLRSSLGLLNGAVMIWKANIAAISGNKLSTYYIITMETNPDASYCIIICGYFTWQARLELSLLSWALWQGLVRVVLVNELPNLICVCALTHRVASLLNFLLSFSGGAWCFVLYSLWHWSSSSANCLEAETETGSVSQGDVTTHCQDAHMTAQNRFVLKCENPRTDWVRQWLQLNVRWWRRKRHPHHPPYSHLPGAYHSLGFSPVLPSLEWPTQ